MEGVMSTYSKTFFIGDVEFFEERSGDWVCDGPCSQCQIRSECGDADEDGEFNVLMNKLYKKHVLLKEWKAL